MLKKTLINNAIALSVYWIWIEAAIWNAPYVLARSIAPNANSSIVEGCIAAFLYVLCGFCLIPVKKRSFLSAVSVAIVLAAILIILIFLGDIVLGYYAVNPIADALQYFDFPMPIRYIVFFLNPVYPSLLFYLGMLLRKQTIGRFRQNKDRRTQL